MAIEPPPPQVWKIKIGMARRSLGKRYTFQYINIVYPRFNNFHVNVELSKIIIQNT